MSRQDSDHTITAVDRNQSLPAGTVLAGRYRIENLLGIGGMGVVYRTTDLSLNVPVAIKLLRSELSHREAVFERFRQEVLLARQISSPHVLRIHDMGRDGERWFISMDFVDGESLDRRIDREGKLPIDQALDIGRQIALGLAAAHECGVIHRDLKPSNVLLAPDGRALIADFGIARSLRASGLTEAGTVMGTPDYLSPEQAAGQTVDARSDLYAWALLLYEMLSGRLPFAGETPAETLSQRIGGYAIPVTSYRSEVPSWVRRLLSRLLRPRPSQRLDSARQVIDVLERRHMPRDWRPLLRRLAVALPLAGGLAAGGWWALQNLSTMQAPPPPQRLLLALEGGRGAEGGRLTALAELMRRQLERDLPVAVIDSERSENALRRWRGKVDDLAARKALSDELPHAWLLSVHLDHTDPPSGLSWRLYRHGDAAPSWQRSAPGMPAASVWTQWSTTLRGELGSASAAIDPVAIDWNPAWLSAFGDALEARWRGQIEQAEQHLLPLLGNEPVDLTLADLALTTGDLAQAEQALAANPAAPDSLRRRLLDLRLSGDWSAAETLLKQALQQRPDDLESIWRLADVLIAEGRMQDAEEWLARGLARDENDPRGWFLRGKAAILRGEVRPAVDDFLVRATLQSKRDRNRFGEAEAINALGLGYARLGQMGDAEEQFRRALSLREAIGHRRGAASSLRNLAQIVMIRGAHEEAAGYLERARVLLDAVGDRAGLAAVDNEAGLLAEEAGNYEAALNAYRKALRTRELLGDRQGVAESQNNLGFAHYQRGDLDSAGVFWRQSIDAFEAVGDRLGLVRAQQNLGLLEIVRGRWSDARSLLQTSLEEAKTQQLSEEMAVSQRNLAELDLLNGDLVAALSHQQAAADLFSERDDLRGGFDAKLLRARIALAALALDEAEQLLAELLPQQADVSLEQQVLLTLLRADLAGWQGDSALRASLLEQAVSPAERSGIRSVQLAVAARQQPEQEAIADELQAFGHRPLQLRWVSEMMSSTAAKPEHYQRAQALLAELPDFVDAWHLHAQGAELLARHDDQSGAESARTRSHAALERLLQRTPEPWQAALRGMQTTESR